ncbi:MAG: hypothetical protein WC506_01030 [Candidatus Micrarchaeia archaeon]
MKVSLVYPGKRGSALEAALALHEISKAAGIDSQLVFSSDLERREKASSVYPDAKFFDFTSFSGISALKRELEGTIPFFTMVSPKLVPLYLAVPGPKALYFHASYDYSFSRPTFRDSALESVTGFLMRRSSAVFATQYPLAWQARLRFGVRADVMPHPTYSLVRQDFFKESREVKLPVADYFLSFGELDRPLKGNGVLTEAVSGTGIPVVYVGRSGQALANQKNSVHLNRWVSDAELFWLVRHSKAVILPYLVSSQFSGCLALAYKLGRPVIAPFSNSFQNYVAEGESGVFFEQGNWNDLREKMLSFDSAKITEKSVLAYDRRLGESLAKQIGAKLKALF